MAAEAPLLFSNQSLSARTKSKSMSVLKGQNAGRTPSYPEIQTAYLSYEVTFFILKEAGIRMNGYASGGRPPPTPSQALNEPSFVEAYEALKKGCMGLKERHEADMTGMVGALGISDSELCGSFHEVCSTIIEEDINWGRITSLFTFTGYLAIRLFREGKSNLIYSLIRWETGFISERILPWVQQHGGWVSFLALIYGRYIRVHDNHVRAVGVHCFFTMVPPTHTLCHCTSEYSQL